MQKPFQISILGMIAAATLLGVLARLLLVIASNHSIESEPKRIMAAIAIATLVGGTAVCAFRNPMTGMMVGVVAGLFIFIAMAIVVSATTPAH